MRHDIIFTLKRDNKKPISPASFEPITSNFFRRDVIMAAEDNLKMMIDETLKLGPVLLIAYLKDMETLDIVLSKLPYITIQPPNIIVRPGTNAKALRVIRDDNKEWLAFVTGGKLSTEETKIAMSVLTEYGDHQMFASPDIAKNLPNKRSLKFPRLKFPR
jgi:hypothetical protein